MGDSPVRYKTGNGTVHITDRNCSERVAQIRINTLQWKTTRIKSKYSGGDLF